MGDRPRILLCLAAPREAEAVGAAFEAEPASTPGSRRSLGEATTLLVTGVGPTAAGVHAAAELARESYDAVISLGIAGAYPNAGIRTLSRVLSTRSILAGEGRSASDGFSGLAAMGFGPFDGRDAAVPSPELVTRLGPVADHTGPIATVSVTSGTDALAAELERRTGALAEAMEGAAVHLACLRARVPFAECRVISNTVGDRDRHPWRLEEALDGLGAAARAVRSEMDR